MVSDSDESLETCALSGTGLLLYWHDLQYLERDKGYTILYLVEKRNHNFGNFGTKLGKKTLEFLNIKAEFMRSSENGTLSNLILELGSEEKVNDLSLFDGKREEVDFLNLLDHTVLYKTS